MVVTIETEPTFTAGNPEVLFRGDYVMASQSGLAKSAYDIAPDGQRFLMIKEDRGAREAAKAAALPPTTELIVVDSWDALLERVNPAEAK